MNESKTTRASETAKHRSTKVRFRYFDTFDKTLVLHSSREMSSPCCRIKLFFLLVVLLMAQAPTLVVGKKFMRCELTRELLQKYQFNKSFLSNWICLVEHESHLDTNKVTTTPTGEGHYGLFQISSKDFCRKDRKGGYCNQKCSDFLDNDINDDVECAKLIFNREGFKYWRGWNNSCRDPQNLPNLEVTCNIHSLAARRLVRNNYAVYG